MEHALDPSRLRAEHVVPADTPIERFDRYAAVVFAAFLPTRTSARKAVKRGELLMDGVAVDPSRWVRPGQNLQLWVSSRPPPKVFELDLDVLFEDDDLAVVHKPAGVPVNGNKHRTVEHALVHNLAPSPRPDAFPWPLPAHRLDVRTEGLLVVAKTSRAHVGLTRAFQARAVHKQYRALVLGRLEGDGVVDAPVEGRAAHTRYAAAIHTPSLRTDWLTTVDLWPTTGRNHQLRRHLASLGHPILGDDLYNDLDRTTLRGKGLFLCSVSVAFEHPISGEGLAVQIDEPHKFKAHRDREARRWASWHAGP